MSHALVPDAGPANFYFGQSLQGLITAVADAIPKICVFLLVLIVGWIVARVLRSVVREVLDRLNFDRFAGRGVVGQAIARSSRTASDLVAMIAYYAILLLVLEMAVGLFGPNPVSRLLSGIVGWLPKAAVAIVIVIVASVIAKAVKDLTGGLISPMQGRWERQTLPASYGGDALSGQDTRAEPADDESEPEPGDGTRY